METNLIPLTAMEEALLRSRGYAPPIAERRGKQFVAISIKGQFRAEALGNTRDEAARNLVKVIVRR